MRAGPFLEAQDASDNEMASAGPNENFKNPPYSGVLAKRREGDLYLSGAIKQVEHGSRDPPAMEF